jgi:5-methylcytosine-specific restriction endonuclease McrA
VLYKWQQKERAKVYDARRRIKRRLLLIAHLGGKCVKCGRDDPDQLEFDHKDPATKTIAISRHMTYPLEILLEELKKCQLLCVECHIKKTHNKELKE